MYSEAAEWWLHIVIKFRRIVSMKNKDKIWKERQHCGGILEEDNRKSSEADKVKRLRLYYA